MPRPDLVNQEKESTSQVNYKTGCKVNEKTIKPINIHKCFCSKQTQMYLSFMHITHTHNVMVTVLVVAATCYCMTLAMPDDINTHSEFSNFPALKPTPFSQSYIICVLLPHTHWGTVCEITPATLYPSSLLYFPKPPASNLPNPLLCWQPLLLYLDQLRCCGLARRGSMQVAAVAFQQLHRCTSAGFSERKQRLSSFHTELWSQ